MDAVAPDGPECARKGLRSPADMQSLFRAATEADTGATRPLPASLAVAQRGEKGGQHWAAWRKCGAYLMTSLGGTPYAEHEGKFPPRLA